VVVRGSKAMTIVYDMASRVPTFIKQSHLETNEGTFALLSQIRRVLICVQLGQPTGPPSSAL